MWGRWGPLRGSRNRAWKRRAARSPAGARRCGRAAAASAWVGSPSSPGGAERGGFPRQPPPEGAKKIYICIVAGPRVEVITSGGEGGSGKKPRCGGRGRFPPAALPKLPGEGVGSRSWSGIGPVDSRPGTWSGLLSGF